MVLSKRLQAVAEMVGSGMTLADVGTDHGYVPIYLVETGVCPSAVATDINEGPAERARANIAAHGLSERIQVRQGDGLHCVRAGETDAILIAGMGGPLMLRILREGAEQARAAKELILSPHSEWRAFRAGLAEDGFAVTDERMTEDGGKYYQILKAVHRSFSAAPDAPQRVAQQDTPEAFTSPDAPQDEAELCYGALLLERRDEVLYRYLRQERDKLRRIQIHLEEQQQTPAVSAAVCSSMEEIRTKLAVNEAALRRYII